MIVVQESTQSDAALHQLVCGYLVTQRKGHGTLFLRPPAPSPDVTSSSGSGQHEEKQGEAPRVVGVDPTAL
ncbi:unnamed protein product [Lota lota]